jgi:hypothetical protein
LLPNGSRIAVGTEEEIFPAPAVSGEHVLNSCGEDARPDGNTYKATTESGKAGLTKTAERVILMA